MATSRCEICETRKRPLLACGDGTRMMLEFCPEHYIEHVELAHEGETLSGCPTIDEARQLQKGDTGE